jgi:RNA polymerase sigma-70 factor (ECF subfamily)
MTQVAKLPPSDQEVVTMTLRSKEHFGVLIERYEAKLKRYIRRLGVHNEEDQLDVLQEIFLKIYRNLNGFDTSLSFSSWAYRIAHNEAVSWYRKQKVRPEGNLVADSEEIVPLLSSHEAGADILFDQSVNAAALNEALATLPARYREVLILRYFEHKEYDEISDILRIPVGSVGTLLHRGKRKLASVLNTETLRI